MLVIPAIDLKGGNVVRLYQGDFKEQTIYGAVPADVARRFEFEGATRLHVVDLDGALKGQPANLAGIEGILKAVTIPIQVGGGVRSLKTAENYFKMGARWVILGTKACLDRGFLKEAIKAFGHNIIVGVDARDGYVAIDGWTRTIDAKADELAREAHSVGVRTIVYTDISRDGALRGPNISEIKKMSDLVPGVDWITSGGVGSLKDLQVIHGLECKNIIGAIVGKALYERRLVLKEAIAACS